MVTAGAADASTGATTGKAATVTPLALAPNCVTFSQYRHGSALTSYHTNVYLHADCASAVRVKIIMQNGYDSSCIQLTKNESMKSPFRSDSDDGRQPYVEQLDAC